MQGQPETLNLQLIGQVRLVTSTGDMTPRSRRAQALLGILALSPPGPIARSRLAALLWERAEPEQARTLLRGAVHDIQKRLSGLAPYLVDATRDHLTLRRNKLHVDTVDMLRQARRPSLDTPPLMEGLEAIGPGFHAWLSTARISFSEQLKAATSEPRRQTIEQGGSQSIGHTTALAGAEALKQPFVAPTTEGRRRSTGIRVGVGAIRCFGLREDDPLAILLAGAIGDALARFRWMSVLPSDMVAGSLASGADVAVARDRLNLDYVVEGQLLRDEARIRLRTSLINVHEQTILASFKADRLVSDLLTFEDEIAAQIAANIDAHIQVVEARRSAASPETADAHGLLMQAIALVCRLDQFSFAKASSLLDRAIELEPEHVSARIGRAQFHMVAASQGWAQNPGAALQKAEEEATVALILDPFEARALSIAGHVRSLRHRQPGDAADIHRQALELNAGSPFALHFAAANDLMRGDLDGARASLDRHRQLVAPTGQHLFVNSAVSLLHLLEGDYEKVLQLSRSVLHLNPGFVAMYKPYLAALGHLGLSAEAKVVRSRLLNLDPTFSIKSLLAGSPFRRIQDSERFTGGLRRAGCA